VSAVELPGARGVVFGVSTTGREAVSERLLGIPRWLAVAGLVGLIAATALYNRGLGVSLPYYDASSAEIAERARAFAAEHAPWAKPVLTVTRTNDFNEEGYRSLCDTIGVQETQRALRSGEIELPAWRVRLRRDVKFSDVDEDADGLTLLLDGRGSVIGGTLRHANASAPAPPRDVAARLATERLAEFGVDLTGFVERDDQGASEFRVSKGPHGVVVDSDRPPDEGRDQQRPPEPANAQTRLKLVWERQDPSHPQVKLTVSATVTADGLISFGRGVKVDAPELDSSTVSKIVEGTVYGLFVAFVVVALLGALLSRVITSDYVNGGRAIFVASVFGVIFLVAALLGADFEGSTFGTLFGATMAAFFSGVIVMSAWLAGEADAYFAWGADRTNSAVALFSGRWRARQVARDTLEGFFWGWTLLGALAVAAVVVAATAGPEAIRRKTELAALDVTPTPLFWVNVLPYAIVVGVVAMLFLPAWLHRLTRRAWIALPVAGAGAGLFAAWLGLCDVSFGQLPPSASWAYVFGLAWCVLSARRSWLTAAVSACVFSIFYYGLAAVTAAATPDGLAAAAGLAVACVPAVAAVAFGPALAEATVREAPPPRMSRIMELVRREEELDIARRVQTALLPGADPIFEGFEVAGTCVPAHEVGGDYYDYFRFADGHFGVAVGDVSGKGVPAAFCMTLTKGFMEVAAAESRAPHVVLAHANEHLRGNLTRGTFVTMAYAVIDPESRLVTCARAGHNPPAILRDGVQPEFVSSPGTALGAADGERFAELIEPQCIELRRGDALVFYTDGVTEAMSPEREQFGEERLLETLGRLRDGRSARGLVDGLLDELGAHAGGAERHDDITIVVIKAA
jgi:hypothetical protein